VAQLCDVKVQVDDESDIEGVKGQELGSHKLDTPSQDFLALKLLFKEDYCVVQTKAGSTFGVLNNKVSRCLSRLVSVGELEYTALMSWNTWQERILPADKNTKKACIGLDINISGPRFKQDDIARGLSQAGLFLQPPHYGTSGLPYENPQYLQIPGMIQVVELPASLGSGIPNAGKHARPADNQMLLWNDGYPDFDKLLDELPQHDYLKDSAVDIRVMTPLLE
jgi:hypothetical protein